MPFLKIAGAACLLSAATLLAFADETSTMSMMKGGEVVAVMPDGHMGTMMATHDQMAGMMKMSKPLGHCVMMMTGTDGRTYMVDTSSKEAIAECEKMAE